MTLRDALWADAFRTRCCQPAGTAQEGHAVAAARFRRLDTSWRRQQQQGQVVAPPRPGTHAAPFAFPRGGCSGRTCGGMSEWEEVALLARGAPLGGAALDQRGRPGAAPSLSAS